MGELRYRDMQRTTDELKLLHDFFCSNGSLRDYELMEWQYFNHPIQKVYVGFAVEEVNGKEKLAASYGVVPYLFKFGDGTAVAVLSIDTLTGAKYRGRGLFTKLATSVYNRCGEEGVALVYGFANKNSAPGFFNRLGWIPLGQTPILLKPLRIRYFFRFKTALNRLASILSIFVIHRQKRPILGGSQEIRPVKDFADKQFDKLWEDFSSTFALGIHRNGAYLNWRFAEKPGANYKTLSLLEKGELKGFVTYCLRAKRGGQTGYIMELIYELGAHSIGKTLLDFAIYEISSQGGEAVFALNFPHSPNHDAFKRKGFFLVPERFHPLESHFGARKFETSGEVKVSERRNWYISYCDADTL